MDVATADLVGKKLKRLQKEVERLREEKRRLQSKDRALGLEVANFRERAAMFRSERDAAKRTIRKLEKLLGVSQLGPNV